MYAMLRAITNTGSLHKLEQYAELRHKLYKTPEYTYMYNKNYLIYECDFRKSFVEYLLFIGKLKYDSVKTIQFAYKQYHRKKMNAVVKIQRAFLQWYYSPDNGPWMKRKAQEYAV